MTKATTMLSCAVLLVGACAKQEPTVKYSDCALRVETTNGVVCIHKDGNVTIPKKGITATSREFWYTLSRAFLQVKDRYCI